MLFVEELTEIMTSSFPDFWKLGQAYIAGSLLMKEVSSYQIEQGLNLALVDLLKPKFQSMLKLHWVLYKKCFPLH